MSLEEDQETAARRYEAFYELAKEEFSSYERRYDQLEAKIGQYVTLLMIILGASVAPVGEVVRIARGTLGVLEWIFLGCYGALLISGLASFTVLLSALKMDSLRVLPIGQQGEVKDAPLVVRFREERYLDLMFLLGVSYLNAARDNARLAEKKVRRAHIGYRAMGIALALSLLTLISYTAVQVRDHDNGESGRQHESAESADR